MTRRAALTGLILAVVVNIWSIYTEYALQSSLLTIAHIPVIAMFQIVLLTAIVNPLLALHKLEWRLSTRELFVVFSMGLIASSVPGVAFSNYFFRVIIPPHYFASAENQWANIFFAYLPDWLVVSNQHDALTWYFEGLPSGESIPWNAWVIPVFWWMAFVGALFLGGSCLIIILRKQWIEYEKLSFPLVQIPLAMLQQDPHRRLPPYLCNRLFWCGFAIPVFILGWNMIDYFIPIGTIPIGTSYPINVTLGRDFPAVPLKINFLVLACAFFTNIEVLFSVWFFQGAATLLTGILNRFGASASAGTLGLNSVMLSHYFGGFVVFVLWSLWIARNHLRNVAHHAFGRTGMLDDRDELLSYRTAVFFLLISIAFVVFWLIASGMTVQVITVFLFTLFILYLGIARIVAETGLAYLDMPVNANEFTVGVLGSGNIQPSSLVSLGLANVYARNWRFFPMTALSHLLYAERSTGRSSNLYVVLCIAASVGMATAILWTIYMGYNPHQVTSFGGVSEFASAGIGYSQIIVTWMNNKTTISTLEQVFFLIGMALAGGLTALRYFLPGWPLHPIGFAIAGSNVVRVVTFSIFLAWLIKVILLRFGGVGLYKKTQPVFIGILVGYTTAVVASSIVDAIWFPGQGHRIHTW